MNFEESLVKLKKICSWEACLTHDDVNFLKQYVSHAIDWAKHHENIPNCTRIPDDGPNLFICTDFSNTGGLISLINLYIMALNGENFALLSNIDEKHTLVNGQNLDERLIVKQFSGSVESKIHKINMFIRNVGPKCIFIITQPYDIIGYIIGLSNRFVPVIFVNHSDSVASPLHYLQGVSIIHSTQLARKQKRVISYCLESYVPLSIPNHDIFEGNLPMATIKTRFARRLILSCGNFHKISENSDPSKFLNTISIVCRDTNFRWLHIGSDFNNIIANSRNDFSLHIKEDCMLYVKKVGSLNKLIQDLNPSFLINTYPKGGGFTLTEAIANGLPIVYNNNQSERYTSHDYIPPCSIDYDHPTGLAKKIKNINFQEYSELAKLTQKFYYENFSYERFLEAFNSHIDRTVSETLKRIK